MDLTSSLAPRGIYFSSDEQLLPLRFTIAYPLTHVLQKMYFSYCAWFSGLFLFLFLFFVDKGRIKRSWISRHNL